MPRGLVIGGPMDGQLLDYRGDYYCAALTEGSPTLLAAQLSAMTTETTVRSVRRFPYKAIKFSYNLWFWIPAIVADDGQYEGRYYESSFDFILARLTANYRPLFEVFQ